MMGGSSPTCLLSLQENCHISATDLWYINNNSTYLGCQRVSFNDATEIRVSESFFNLKTELSVGVYEHITESR